MTHTQAQLELVEALQSFCSELNLKPEWTSEELLCLEPLPASASPRILISFSPNYWRVYGQRSQAAKAQARFAVLGMLTSRVPALRSLGQGEVYAVRALMTAGI